MKKLISVLCTVLIVLSTVIPTVYAEPYDMESVQSAVTLSEETEHNHTALAESAQTPALLSEHTHTGTFVWQSDEQVHSKYWSCCCAFDPLMEAHNWENGKCTDCGYVCGHMGSTGDCSICGYRCNHSGGTATCTQKAVCDKCGEAYGELNSTNHTGTFDWRYEEQAHSKYWSCCRAFDPLMEAHTWVNGKCTECGFVCHHTDSPGDCSICGYRCNHSGGTATCTQKAVCDNCGEAYGELNSTNHTGTQSWKTAETAHQRIWGCCGKAILLAATPHTWENGKCTDCGYVCGHSFFSIEGQCLKACVICSKTVPAHKGQLVWSQSISHHSQYWSCCMETSPLKKHHWENGECTECGYVCNHTGGTATCTQKAVCYNCGEAYGNVKPSNHSGTESWKITETTHQRIWGCCGKAILLIPIPHTWENGECTECGYVCNHTGGTATCTQKAVCTYCHNEYGELANHSLSKTDAKDATCTEDGNTAYWTCSVCHKLFSDEDGTNETTLDAVTIKAAHKLTKTEAKDATCTEDGNIEYWTCSVCHKLFSDEDGTNETTLDAVTIKAAHKLTKTEARNATVTETGNIEYWQCQDCGDIFSDPDGKNEITLEDTVIAKLPPKIIEGTGQSVTAGEKKALSFRSNAAFSDFIRVELDGKTLDEKNYTVKEGSTVVTLKADYVATLSAGEHTIGIVSESGTATTTFTVNAKAVVDNDTKSPQTGDNSHMALWIALLFMSGAGVIGTMVYGKKRRAK